MDNLYNWNTLSTLAGASALAFLIVAYTKRIADKYWPKILGTDMYVVAISFVILYSSMLATDFPASIQNAVSQAGLCFFNAFLVAAAAGKMSDKTIDESKK